MAVMWNMLAGELSVQVVDVLSWLCGCFIWGLKMFIEKVTPWLERWLRGALTEFAEDWDSCPITFLLVATGDLISSPGRRPTQMYPHS